MNTPEPVNLGRYREVLSGQPEDVLAHLRKLAEKATNHSSQLEDLREEVLRLVRVEGDET